MHGAKSMQKNKETLKRRRDVSTLVEEIHGVTTDHVRKVIRGDRNTEEIRTTCMEIIERYNLSRHRKGKRLKYTSGRQYDYMAKEHILQMVKPDHKAVGFFFRTVIMMISFYPRSM